MPTSQATLILREVEHGKPISAKTRAFQRRRLQNRFHRFILRTFREQQRKNGLTQKQLAERIDSRPEQVNRWLSISGNLTLNTISDLLLGMAVDLDDPSATPLLDLAHESEQETGLPTIIIREAILNALSVEPPVAFIRLAEPNVATKEAVANTYQQSIGHSFDIGQLGRSIPKGFDFQPSERRPTV
jgi:transcriptional regulator with XRE-family HTH domain